MKKRIATALLLVFTTSIMVKQASAQTGNETDNQRTFQISFVYPLSTEGFNSTKYVYNSSFNILGGVTGGLNGAEFGGLFNINLHMTKGVQFAGLFNKANEFEGVQFAGLTNLATSSQFATQFAGILNYFEKGTTFTQVAGIANVGDTSTTQVAGLANKTNETKCQIAGITNIANESKFQLAAIANVSRKSKVQIGIVNVSDTANVMVGLVNIAKNGFIEGELAGGEFLHATASFRSGTKRLYGIISFGYNFDDEFFGYGAGLGTTFELKDNWGINVEAVQYTLATKKFNQEKFNGLTQLRPLFYYQFSKRLKVFAGPVANLYIANNTADNKLQISAPYTIWSSYGSKTKLEAWIGFTAGVRF